MRAWAEWIPVRIKVFKVRRCSSASQITTLCLGVIVHPPNEIHITGSPRVSDRAGGVVNDNADEVSQVAWPFVAVLVISPAFPPRRAALLAHAREISPCGD